MLVRLGDCLLGNGVGAGDHRLRFGRRGCDRAVRLLLGGGQHPLSAVLCLGLEPVNLLLGVAPELVCLFLGRLAQVVSIRRPVLALRLGFVGRKLEYLADPLADLFMRRAAGRGADVGDLVAQVLDLGNALRQPALELPNLSGAPGDVVVYLLAVVTADLALPLHPGLGQ